MDAHNNEILNIISSGESSRVQFKERADDTHKLSQEFVAFANTKGGTLLIGINDKTGTVHGLSFEEIQKTNRVIADAAAQNVKPPITVETETISIDGEKIIAVYIAGDLKQRPYKDKNGAIWIKNGSDKRRAVNNEEIMRLFQRSLLLYADEMTVYDTGVTDINLDYYKKIFEQKFRLPFDKANVDLTWSLRNQRLMRDDALTLAGTLLFCDNRERFCPVFTTQCAAVNAPDLLGNTFDDNEPAFMGKLEDVYYQTMKFIDRNMKKVPSGESFNSPLRWQIPKEVFEELIVNALVHRDYFINSTVKIFMFSDRIEIISPGRLPNSQTEETIKNGLSISRNPVLQSMAQYVLPYRGLGTGITRALAVYPAIEFKNDIENERFISTIRRPVARV